MHIPPDFPLYLRCALECFTAYGERTRERLVGLVEWYATQQGQQVDPDLLKRAINQYA